MLYVLGDSLRERLPGHERVVPPLSVSLRSHPARFSGGTGCRLRRASFAADEPDVSSSAEVKPRYTTGMGVQRHALSACYLMSPKGKKKRHTTLKYLQKLGCVEMIIKGCLTSPSSSCPLRGSKKHYLL